VVDPPGGAETPADARPWLRELVAATGEEERRGAAAAAAAAEKGRARGTEMC
jgi:hypothetical protein